MTIGSVSAIVPGAVPVGRPASEQPRVTDLGLARPTPSAVPAAIDEQGTAFVLIASYGAVALLSATGLAASATNRAAAGAPRVARIEPVGPVARLALIDVSA